MFRKLWVWPKDCISSPRSQELVGAGMFFHTVNCLEACIRVFSLDDLEVFEIILTLYEQSMFFLLFHLPYQLRMPPSLPVKYHFFSFVHVSTGIPQTKAKTKCSLLKMFSTKSTAGSCLGGGKPACRSSPHTADWCTHRLLFREPHPWQPSEHRGGK